MSVLLWGSLAFLPQISLRGAGLPDSLGTFDAPFYLSERSVHGPLSFTLQENSILFIDQHLHDEDVYSSTESLTEILLKRNGGTVLCTEQSSDMKTQYYSSLPSGSYEIVFNGEITRLTVMGCPAEDTDLYSGYDYASAYDLGNIASTVSLVHQKDVSLHSGSHYAEVSKDMFYRFNLAVPMEVAITTWGSPVVGTIPSSYVGYRNRLALFRFSEGAGLELLYDTFSPTVREDNCVEKNQGKIPETMLAEDCEMSLFCQLSAGTYYLIAESPLYKTNATTKAFDGVIRTTLHAFRPEGSAQDLPIETGTDGMAPFCYEDTRNADNYPQANIYYAFETLRPKEEVVIDVDGGEVLSVSGCEAMPGDSVWVCTIGRHIVLVQGDGGAMTTRIRSLSFSPQGRSAETPIDISMTPDCRIVQKACNLDYFRQEGGTAKIYFRIILPQESCLAIDHKGTAIPLLKALAESEDNFPVPASSSGDDVDIYCLPPGAYIYTVEASVVRGIVLTAFRLNGLFSPVHHALQPSSQMNYISTTRPTCSGVTVPDHSNSVSSVGYYDLLGRPVQTVQHEFSPYGEDIAGFYLYDNGRLAEQWRPVALSKSDGAFSEKQEIRYPFLCQGDTATYTKTLYTDDLLDRVSSVTGAGAAWHAAGKSVKTEYLVNEASGELSCQMYGVSNESGSIRRPFRGGLYPAGALRVMRSMDEDGRVSLRFEDGFSQTLLERRVLVDSTYADTYYVYDDRHLLSVVIPPGGAALFTGLSIPQSEFERYCWAYAYDGKRHCIQKMEPGGSRTRYVYGKSGALLFSQTADQATRYEWTCTVPDALGRPALEMLVTAPNSWVAAFQDSDLHAVYVGAGGQFGGYNLEGGVIDYNTSLLVVNWYDDYSFLSPLPPGGKGLILTSLASGCHDSVRRSDGTTPTLKGFLTGSLVNAETDGTDAMLYRLYGYDYYGRLVRRCEENRFGGFSVYGTTYDFQGNVLSTTERHYSSGGSAHNLLTEYGYDFTGRLLWSRVIADGDTLARREFGYTPMGELESVRTRTVGLDDVSLMEYNVRGWLTRRRDGVFDASLRYESPSCPDTAPEWGGNISEWEWSGGGSDAVRTFGYDGLSRLVSEYDWASATSSAPSKIRKYTYDLHGNRTSRLAWAVQPSASSPDMTEVASTYWTLTASDPATCVYDGDRLSYRREGASLDGGMYTGPYYGYDASGRMTYDARTGLSLTYNRLDRVEKVMRDSTILAKYSYLADGTKVGALDGEGNGFLYSGSLIYRKTGNDVSLESMGWEGGRIVAEKDLWGDEHLVPLVYSTDHLGSVRAVRDGLTGQIVDLSDYDGYGIHSAVALDATAPAPSPAVENSLRYRYNGKEDQRFTGVPYLDYGARLYDPVTARWLTPDPLGEKYYSLSPYAYCADNPVNLIDPDGTEMGDFETGLFILRHPKIAMRVGMYQRGSNNISTVATRFATRGPILVDSQPKLKPEDKNIDEGTQVGAFRHTLWQAMISAEFSPSIAKQIGDAHEENPTADTRLRVYSELRDADQTADLLNNKIGRNIGGLNTGASAQALSMLVLDMFYTEGLYTASQDADGNWVVKRTTITDKQYEMLKQIFSRADNYGRDKIQ